MIMKKLVLFTLALSLLLFFAGCQNTAAAPAADPVNIVFVLGIADGESVVAAESIRELAALPSQPGSSYAFVSVESSSAPIGESDVIADLTDRGYTEDMMKRVRQGIRADLNGRVASYVPSTAEIDLAAAVTCAPRPSRRSVSSCFSERGFLSAAGTDPGCCIKLVVEIYFVLIGVLVDRLDAVEAHAHAFGHRYV